MNSTPTEFSFDESTLNTYENTILEILLFMISVPGTVFLIALIQFDRIGGDPLKRRIIDQVSIGNFPLAVEYSEYPLETKFIFKLFTSPL